MSVKAFQEVGGEALVARVKFPGFAPDYHLAASLKELDAIVAAKFEAYEADIESRTRAQLARGVGKQRELYRKATASLRRGRKVEA